MEQKVFILDEQEEKQDVSRIPVDLTGKRILWVEDDKFLSDLIAIRLAETKCELIHVSNGEAAFKSLAEKQPDIIILDILLPGMDGFEILKHIKEDQKTAAIPVIMLSNLSQQVDIEKGRSLGASRFLVKATVSMDEIVDQIRATLSSVKK